MSLCVCVFVCIVFVYFLNVIPFQKGILTLFPFFFLLVPIYTKKSSTTNILSSHVYEFVALKSACICCVIQINTKIVIILKKSHFQAKARLLLIKSKRGKIKKIFAPRNNNWELEYCYCIMKQVHFIEAYYISVTFCSSEETFSGVAYFPSL